ncbi:alpha/beta fold hydrolase [Streptomyces fragilis]|uniref:Alpha/beta fold hydrolase n=1 Tax=Streptomyces fragilis TaxID=67301 RepID=A0ABV2YG93_9ACTN|nr:alpha/beta fold hydrolase [Streptomyces fragilis]
MSPSPETSGAASPDAAPPERRAASPEPRAALPKPPAASPEPRATSAAASRGGIRRIVTLLCALLVLCALPAPALAGDHRAGDTATLRPVIFVHGSSGSGGQFETQARRLTGNGFPAQLIETHEYDSTFATTTPDAVYAALDRRIDALLERSGADRVDLLAHSLGTLLMQAYLRSSPERAAKVAHYVNLDGRTSADLPGGVPTLAVWGEGDPARAVGGARNVYLPGQAHTETVTSEETFAEFYRFFHGEEPRTTRVLPELSITLSGRAQIFPTNVPVAGVRLEIHRIDPLTGARIGSRPEAVQTLGADGAWGPVRAWGQAHYEFALVWDEKHTHHLYFPPFQRSDHLVRLLTSRPGEGISGQVETGDGHSALTVTRQKEWWGDQGASGDTLSVEGVQVLNAANAPRVRRTIGMFLFDAGSDKVTDLSAPLQPFFQTPFLTGMDVYLPATSRRDRPLTLVSRPRGEGGRVDVLRVPAWPSSTDRVSVQFDDH